MQKESALILFSLLASQIGFAIPPVTLSGPTPAIASTYPAGSARTLVYTITNRAPKSLPIRVEGLSTGFRRTTVANDCGNSLPPANGSTPSMCNIGIAISLSQAQVGSTVNQTVEFNYQGMKPLTAQISFSARQSMLYVTNQSTLTISQCVVNLETGVISPCSLFSDPSLNGPSEIVVNPLGTIVYISNFDTNSISQCPVQANGLLGPCTVFNGTGILSGPAGMTLNNTGRRLYVANFSNNTIAVCTINNAGRISQCSSSVPGTLNGPDDIALDPLNQFAYITNIASNNLLICSVDANENLSHCMLSDPIFSSPTGISINAAGTRLYVNNSEGNTVAACSLKPGSIGTCINSNPNGNFEISFGKSISYLNSLLFVANSASGANTVSVCTLGPLGDLVNCPAFNPNGTYIHPQGIAIN